MLIQNNVADMKQRHKIKQIIHLTLLALVFQAG